MYSPFVRFLYLFLPPSILFIFKLRDIFLIYLCTMFTCCYISVLLDYWLPQLFLAVLHFFSETMDRKEFKPPLEKDMLQLLSTLHQVHIYFVSSKSLWGSYLFTFSLTKLGNGLCLGFRNFLELKNWVYFNKHERTALKIKLSAKGPKAP